LFDKEGVVQFQAGLEKLPVILHRRLRTRERARLYHGDRLPWPGPPHAV